jgi:hypothetical protein
VKAAEKLGDSAAEGFQAKFASRPLYLELKGVMASKE